MRIARERESEEWVENNLMPGKENKKQNRK